MFCHPCQSRCASRPASSDSPNTENLNLELNGSEAPRLGVIGSRSKWQEFEKQGLQKGISQDMLDSVICPIGLNIGAQSPEEIAIAVLAQVMSNFKNIDSNEPNWR